MIDYEVKIFNKVHAAVASMCAKDRVVSTPIDSYAKIPAVSLYEMDSQTVRKRQSTSQEENFARVTYQLDVVAGTKAKCRSIYAAADDCMIAMNFARISGDYVTYPENTKIVRYVARYTAEIDPDGNIYRMS